MKTSTELVPALPEQQLLGMISGAWVAQAIFVAAKLGIADLVKDEPRSAESLAEVTNVHPRALFRVLRALASLGIFAEKDGGRFGLTELAKPLLSDLPTSIRPFAVMMGSEWVWRSWGEIMHSVTHEKPAFEKVYGAPVFDYWAANPEAGRLSFEGLTSRSVPENAAVVSAYDFSSAGTVVDVGGGQGSLLVSILAANPELRGVLFDMPHVIEAARPVFEQAGLAGRCDLVAGDFFGSVPAGGDVYLLKKVIHDWEDEEAGTILRTCRAALSGEGRLLLIEPVIPAGNEPSFPKLLDLLMLVLPGGRERTEAEHEALLASAGLRVERIIPTLTSISILVAKASDRKGIWRVP